MDSFKRYGAHEAAAEALRRAAELNQGGWVDAKEKAESTARAFIRALAPDLPTDERLILCGFPGDPFTAPKDAWRPRPWRPGDKIPFGPSCNAYVCVSSFRAGPDGFRRRKDNFAAGRCLMIDDVGTKVQRAQVQHLKPSAIVETSQGNEQWFYFFREPERDRERFDNLIKAFIAGRLLGAKDPGMGSVTRVGRLPGFTNGKPANNGWQTRLLDLNEQRFSVQHLLAAFGLKEAAAAQRQSVSMSRADALRRVRIYLAAEKYLRERGMLKGNQPDRSGWTECTCPWLEEHTGRADTGAAICEPGPQNNFRGGFKCHHGHCDGRGWRDVVEWMTESIRKENGHATQQATRA
jgi:hypothetical protein